MLFFKYFNSRRGEIRRTKDGALLSGKDQEFIAFSPDAKVSRFLTKTKAGVELGDPRNPSWIRKIPNARFAKFGPPVAANRMTIHYDTYDDDDEWWDEKYVNKDQTNCVMQQMGILLRRCLAL